MSDSKRAPVCGLPCGISEPLSEENRIEIEKWQLPRCSLKFALKIFHDIVLGNPKYVEMIKSDAYTIKTYYMGLVEHTHTLSDSRLDR